MKKANQNEMDLALQSLAKSERDESLLRARSASVLASDELSGDHLDADELNSYAEGLVPDLARARYTEHLADCTSCRRILVTLSAAVGTPRLNPEPEAEPGRGFWVRISAFLSMPAVRYGVPALGLAAVLAISFMSWRQERRADLVAQHQPQVMNERALERQVPGAQTKEEPFATTGSESSPNPNRNLAIGSANKGAETDGARVSKSPTSADLENAPALKDSAAPPPPPAPAAVVPREQPTFAEAPKADTLASKRATDEVQTSAERKQESLSRVAQERDRDADKFEAQKEAEDNRAFSTNAPSGPRRSEGVFGGLSRKNKKAADEEETRSIGGRRFKRQGSLWIDTVYESSRATINVKRNSDQFRALVADEPGIRTIANGLGGEFIVVWKNKAYRIY